MDRRRSRKWEQACGTRGANFSIGCSLLLVVHLRVEEDEPQGAINVE